MIKFRIPRILPLSCLCNLLIQKYSVFLYQPKMPPESSFIFARYVQFTSKVTFPVSPGVGALFFDELPAPVVQPGIATSYFRHIQTRSFFDV